MPRVSRGPRLFRRNGVFYVLAFNGRGKPIRKSTGTRDPAEAREVLGLALLGTDNTPSPPLSVILEGYWKDNRGRLASAATARQGIDRLKEFFTASVAELTPSILRSYYTAGRKVAPTTKAREMTVLRAALNYAVKEGWIQRAPVVPVISPAEPRERWLTRQEAAKLLWQCRGNSHLALFVRLALYTGARTRAILDLQWKRVDLKRGRIDYNPAGRRQTHKKRPVVAIGPRLSATLQRALMTSESPYVVSYRGERVDRVIKGFKLAAERAKLEGVTPHTLRHTAATWMAQNGLPLPLIAGMLGQSIQRTTERYIKHSPDFMAGAAQALERGKVLGR